MTLKRIMIVNWMNLLMILIKKMIIKGNTNLNDIKLNNHNETY